LREFVLQLSVTDISPKKYNQDKLSIAGIKGRASGLCHCKLQTIEHIYHNLLNNLLGIEITHSPQST